LLSAKDGRPVADIQDGWREGPLNSAIPAAGHLITM
jgi:hypothetical protein